jgi:exoribonuclease R
MYGILFFTSKSRVLLPKNKKGIEFVEYKTNVRYIVPVKKEYTTDMWAKVKISSGDSTLSNTELMEIVGPTCDKSIEYQVLFNAFSILYRYPPSIATFMSSMSHTQRAEKSHYNIYNIYNIYNAYTVDDVTTTDRDDAISIDYIDKDRFTLGIHIIDLVRFFGIHRETEEREEILKWSQQVASSAYWENGSKPVSYTHLRAHETG